MSAPLPRDFYLRDTVTVAKDLLGKVLVSDSPQGRCAGIIVETEAYLYPDDPDNHAYHGPTNANASMYLPGGSAYVYFLYGAHWLLNAVTREAGVPEAVLLRSLQPTQGLETMRGRRGGVGDLLLTTGPARLTQALAIDGSLDGADLTSGPLMILYNEFAPQRVESCGRVGCYRAPDRLLRFFIARNPYVSRGPAPSAGQGA